MTWTADALATTTRLWGEGYSATEIAKAVKARHGIEKTRNAVIGVIHRAKMPKRQRAYQPPKPRPDPTRRMRPPIKPSQTAKMILQAAEPVDPLNIPLADLNASQCHAVTDTTRFAQRYCGRPVMLGCNYCGPHFARYRVFTAKKARAR